jgi:hypothetical protein
VRTDLIKSVRETLNTEVAKETARAG